MMMNETDGTPLKDSQLLHQGFIAITPYLNAVCKLTTYDGVIEQC
jgi:hypothetical protein